MTAVKLKTCKNKGCTVKFPQFNSIVAWCSPKCGQEIAAAQIKKDYDTTTKQMRKDWRGNNRSYQMKKAGDRFREYIRLRDKGLPCISCGTTSSDVQYAAGHFKTVAARPELKFHPDNCHLQCNRNCNMGRSGNVGEYRINLIERIGVERVEWLEGKDSRAAQNLTLDDIKDINQHYKELIRAI